MVYNNTQINENTLFIRVSKIIEKRKNHAGMYPNREVMFIHLIIAHNNQLF
jgi:hypothetical protein